MPKKDWEKYVALIKHEVVPALGCTEPVAVALACAVAKKHLGRNPDEIEVWVSGNLMKNGMGVGVPGTGMVGLPVAAAAGAIGGDPEAKLEVLKSLTPKSVSAAKTMIDAGKVTVKVKNVPNILYVEVTLKAGSDSVTVIIKDDHTNIVSITKNGETIFQGGTSGSGGDKEWEELHKVAENMDTHDVWEFAIDAPLDMIDFIYEAVELNEKISEEGLKGDYGLKVGKTMAKNIERGILQKDLLTEVMERSSSASDARMDGCELPVMANSGSGNQGITATIPVVVVAERAGANREHLIRALILSHLMAIHIKSHLERLSALCAATVAAMGASCGMVFLMGGTLKQAQYAIENMIGDVAGIICDGAKTSCSLKVSSSVAAAVKAALMGLDNIRVTENEGIVDRDVEQVIKNLGTVTEGMRQTDKTILDIMTHKHH